MADQKNERMHPREIARLGRDVIGSGDEPKDKGELLRVEVEPAENGHVVTAHYRRKARGAGEDGPAGPEHHEERHVFQTGEEAGDHVAQLLE